MTGAAIPKFIQPGVEHYERSRQVAEDFLKENACEPGLAARVLECIACHHGGPAERSIESRLFTDADALDLLGTLGALRIFAMNSRDPARRTAGAEALPRHEHGGADHGTRQSHGRRPPRGDGPDSGGFREGDVWDLLKG